VKLRNNEEWVNLQFGQCELGNALRTRRLKRVAVAMLSCPEQSLSKQNPEWADLKGAYRLFSNEHVSFRAVAEPHWKQTRGTKPGRYLLISDTTDVEKSSHPATEGMGMLGNGEGRGMQLHSCLVYNCDQQSIEGTAGALVHYRSRTSKTETRMQRLDRDRESQVWGKLVEEIGRPPAGSRWIHVFDRGGDNFEAMCHILSNGCDFVIRVAKLQRNVVTESGETLPLKQAISSAKVLGRYTLALRSRPGVKARTAELQVSVLTVTFPQPRPCSQWVKQCGIDNIRVNVVVVEETKVKQGVTPIRWILMTSLPVETFQQAWQVIDDYERRWLIEEYHKVLKTGCRMESHALRTADRLEALIGLISVIGTRLLQLKLIGRYDQQAKAKNHVPAGWLKGLELARPKLQGKTLTVYEFFRELAKMGGFLARKGDGEPGWQTVWYGFQKLQLLLQGMRLARPI